MIFTFPKWVIAVLRSCLANSWMDKLVRLEFELALILTLVVQMHMKLNMLTDLRKSIQI